MHVCGAGAVPVRRWQGTWSPEARQLTRWQLPVVCQADKNPLRGGIRKPSFAGPWASQVLMPAPQGLGLVQPQTEEGLTHCHPG